MDDPSAAAARCCDWRVGRPPGVMRDAVTAAEATDAETAAVVATATALLTGDAGWGGAVPPVRTEWIR